MCPLCKRKVEKMLPFKMPEVVTIFSDKNDKK